MRVKLVLVALTGITMLVASYQLDNANRLLAKADNKIIDLEGEIYTLKEHITSAEKQYLDLNADYMKVTEVNPYLKDIRKFVNGKTGISDKIKIEIYKAILDSGSKFNINPLILTALIDVESSYRFWIEHKKVQVTLNNGIKANVRAVGLGGIVWEFWGEKLKANKIANNRSDLFDPATNITAIAYVLSELQKRDLKAGTKTKMESALIRYFGGNYKSYLKKIEDRVFHIIKERIL
jgi:hypothetical protein